MHSTDEYTKVLKRALHKIRSFKANYFVIPFGISASVSLGDFGANTYIDDPDCSHDIAFSLILDDYSLIATKIKELGIPTW